jgi:hypothetical protein
VIRPPLKWSDLRYSLARLVEVNGKWAAHERVLRRSFLLFVLRLTITVSKVEPRQGRQQTPPEIVAEISDQPARTEIGGSSPLKQSRRVQFLPGLDDDGAFRQHLAVIEAFRCCLWASPTRCGQG